LASTARVADSVMAPTRREVLFMRATHSRILVHEANGGTHDSRAGTLFQAPTATSAVYQFARSIKRGSFEKISTAGICNPRRR